MNIFQKTGNTTEIAISVVNNFQVIFFKVLTTNISYGKLGFIDAGMMLDCN